MKRKLIQLAGKTLVVSVPSKWARQMGLRKGDEVEVLEKDEKLILSAAKDLHIEKAVLDVRAMEKVPLGWVISALHKSGYDEIEIAYEGKDVPRKVGEVVKNLFIGFAVTEQSSERIVIRRIAQEVEGEFDAMLRRAFLVTLSMGESLAEHLGNGKGDANDLLALEHTNNQLTNFCERILVKKGYKEYRKTCFCYCIVWNLEKVCDNYKYIINDLGKQKQRKEAAKILLDVNSLLRSYFELLFKFESQKLNDLVEEKKRIEEDAKKLLEKDPVVASHLLHAVTQISDFTASIIALNS